MLISKCNIATPYIFCFIINEENNFKEGFFSSGDILECYRRFLFSDLTKHVPSTGFVCVIYKCCVRARLYSILLNV